jgi:NAD(P)-dependent dehydrogenase (short-subunit alcohol dehydrogenase family)
VRDGAAVRKCADETIAALGQVDILVNNAGFMAPGYFLDQPAEQWEKTVAVNLQGVISTVRAFLPHMYERGTGRIINISSAAGLIGVPGLSVYSASKWGVFGLTEALREEAWASGHPGVKYSSVHPMFLLTGMFEGARLRGLGGLVFPCVKSHDRIAKAVVEGAVVRGRRCIKRPRSLRAVLLLRGLLPDAVFAGIGRFMKLHASMESWKGRATEKERV